MADFRVYIAEKDIFLTTDKNVILWGKTITPTQRLYLYYLGTEKGKQSGHLDLQHSEMIYAPGTTVVPIYDHFRQARDAGISTHDWARVPGQRNKCPVEYGGVYPVVRDFKLLSPAEYADFEEKYSSLKAEEDERVEEEIRKIREGRNKTLDSMVDFLLTQIK